VSPGIQLTVNGIKRRLTAAPDTPLLYVLRNDLQLKGTRFGCGLGQCGACNVLVDGRKAASCNMPLWACEGRSVTTVEGLGQAGHLHALQQALLDGQAAQCGYCLNGIVISAQVLLATNPAPSEAQVRAALDDNLCRCGTHNRIVAAVLRVARAGTAESVA